MIKFSEDYLLVSSAYNPSEGYTERRDRRRAERETLEANGFKTEYRFKLSERAKAEKLVAKIKKQTGVILEINEAFGMSF